MLGRSRSLVALLATASAVTTGQVEHGAVLALTNVTVIDGRGTSPRPDHTVVIDGPLIADMFRTGEKPLPRNARVHDFSGHYVVPGFIDTHVHVSGRGGRPVEPRLRRALRGGVTTVRRIVENCTLLAELARKAAAGEIEAPEIYFASIIIGRAGWEGNPRRAAMKPLSIPVRAASTSSMSECWIRSRSSARRRHWERRL